MKDTSLLDTFMYIGFTFFFIKYIYLAIDVKRGDQIELNNKFYKCEVISEK